MHEHDIQDDETLDWSNEEGATLPAAEGSLIPFGWKVLIMPIRPKAKSAGGIIIPSMVQAKDQYLSYTGQIVALGPLAFKHAKYADMGLAPEDMPARGQWWLFPQYTGHRIDHNGTKLLLVNDDSFIGRVPDNVDPWQFKVER